MKIELLYINIVHYYNIIYDWTKLYNLFLGKIMSVFI